MRISDWSSDVCSSDLFPATPPPAPRPAPPRLRWPAPKPSERPTVGHRHVYLAVDNRNSPTAAASGQFDPETATSEGENNMTKVTIYHNPACGTSRNTLALIRNSGVEPTIIKYLQTPPSREQLKRKNGV